MTWEKRDGLLNGQKMFEGILETLLVILFVLLIYASFAHRKIGEIIKELFETMKEMLESSNPKDKLEEKSLI